MDLLRLCPSAYALGTAIEGGLVSTRIPMKAVLATLLWVGLASAPAAAEDAEGESFAAFAYVNLPFSSKPYLGVMVERDRVEASRPEARNYVPLWLRPKVIDVHLSARTLVPLRINGRRVYGMQSSSEADGSGWASRID